MKIQTKTTILFTLITAGVFLVLSITIYYFSDNFAHNDFYKRLELRARISTKFRFEKDHVSTEAFAEIQRQYLERLIDEKAFVVQVDTTGKPIKDSPKNLPLSYLKNIFDAKGGTVYYRDKNRHYAGLFYPDETGDFLVIKSATNPYVSELMMHLRSILIITFIVSVIFIYALGRYFANKTFQPFRLIINRVKDISEVNLHLRLEKQEGTDEVAELIKTFNNMLDRLETAFETQNNFISNASHELRTPLTAIVAEADYALSKERTPDAYQQSLNNIILQAEKLQHLTKGLLSLAHTGFDGEKQKWEFVHIEQLLLDIKESMGSWIGNNRIRLVFSDMLERGDDHVIHGNYDLLKIAIGNIVLNACKYSNSDVTIDLVIEREAAEITIIDKGIGIPEMEIKHIYDPFFRASNTGGYEGYGIGMPLSNNIIRLHKGRIEIDSKVNIGSKVKVVLPLAAL